MSLPLPPASHLKAILLVTQSRSLGPRLVFHYPPLSPSAAALAANKVPAWFGNEATTASVDSNSSGSDWDSSTDNDGGDEDAEVGSRTSGRGSGRTSFRDRDKHKASGGGIWGRQETIDEDDAGLDEYGNLRGDGKEIGGDHDWETVLGFKVDALEKMLCPPKAFNKRRFELGVESIVLLGAPMFVRDDGLWKKRRRKKEKKRSTKGSIEDANLLANLKTAETDEGSTQEGGHHTEPFVYPEGYEPGYGHGLMSGAASEAGSDAHSSSTTDHARDDMTMFNVVFVLNPPALEYQYRVKEMYDNVTRKFAKALKFEQARCQYVWKESKKIIHIKQRAKDNGETLSTTWREIINSSPLAKSVAALFDAISNDKIAHIYFDEKFNTSFQIPQPDSTPFLPSAMEPQMPGLWLTTSNVAVDEDNAPMTQHAALLLLQDPETLVKDLEADAKERAGSYIRNIVPTKSLQKLSVKHNIRAHEMEYIASHLVYWRRARLINPLHPRDTYIVSPNADLSALPAAIPAYSARFPTLPSLPKILNLLSGTPRPYRTFIPTNEHREAYMEILAWLMRGGWVTQLRTYAWVRVSPEIKALVAQDMEREAQLKKAEDARREADADSMTGSIYSDKRASLLSAGRPSTPMRRPPRREEDEDMEGGRILSPRSAYRGSPARPASDAGSTSSIRTTVPLSSTSGHPASPAHTAHAQTKLHRPLPLQLKGTSPSRGPTTHKFSPTSPSASRSQSISGNPGGPTSPPPLPPSHTFTPSIVLCPQKANALEARWLEKIGQSFQDAELREYWPMLLKHLDGKHAMEDIYAREGIKRKRVAALVSGVREAGWLVVARHW
ncbi:uncharacterized protein EI97DRAFT_433534 [Westerdykella ornata]|uniref:Nitrogen permease regulator 3 n=1 Tax=Westerdykella ornata TaxID=318751 RepID=A0A6A6JI78_WESOR|nr:uncharacterized protein EI97DRAFT_433534 [Westerdykella ornata]KAF2276122.1 hypothetical protein EI97DRAFT_433534 [Westerdykella ornata]